MAASPSAMPAAPPMTSPDAGAAAGTGADAAPGTPFPDVSDYAMPGPYEFEREANVGPEGAFTLFRPRELGRDGVKHPIVTWGNGTGANPDGYAGLLEHLASHGFIVIASNSPNVGSGMEMLEGVEWVRAEHARSGSVMFGHIDTQRVGATGHSQGGVGACACGEDARLTTIVALQGASRCMTNRLEGRPALLLAGGMDGAVSPDRVEAWFDALDGPAMFGVLRSAGHLTGSGDAGGFRRPITAWFRYHLMSDQAARPLFYGTDCGLCADPEWTVKQQGL